MKLLALEASTETCSVALWRDGDLDSRECGDGRRNSEVLLPMVDELLAAHSVRVMGLDAIAFGAGPGSFTGLRVACGVAQGLAFGAGVPLLGIGTLLAMAELSRAPRVVCCLDARMGEVYHAAYEWGGGEWNEVHAPSLCKPTGIPLPESAGWSGCGSGFKVYGPALLARLGGKLASALSDVMPHARQVAALAVRDFQRGKAVSAEHAQPLYVRDKVALRVDER